MRYRSGESKIYNVYDGRERKALREFVQKSTPGTSWEMLLLKRECKRHSYTKGLNPGPEFRKKKPKGKDSDDKFSCFNNTNESKDDSGSDANGAWFKTEGKK